MKISTGSTALRHAAAIIGLACACSAQALPLIVNGGFEAGLASWVTADQVGSEGTFSVQNGTSSPLSGWCRRQRRVRTPR